MEKIDALTEFVKTYGAKGLAYIALDEQGEIKSSFAKFMEADKLELILQKLEAKAGDLLFFVADKNSVVYASLGALRCEIAQQLELLDKNVFKFVWVTDFPLLEWDEEAERFKAVHHPFTSPKDEDMQYLDTDPARVRG